MSQQSPGPFSRSSPNRYPCSLRLAEMIKSPAHFDPSANPQLTGYRLFDLVNAIVVRLLDVLVMGILLAAVGVTAAALIMGQL